jgi:hypothetical protein
MTDRTEASYPQWRAARLSQTIQRSKIAGEILGVDAPEEIHRTIETMDFLYMRSMATSKQGKIAARKLASSLRGLKAALKNENLWLGLRRLPADFITEWIQQCDNEAAINLKMKHEKIEYEKLAANTALTLMRKYHKRVTTTKGSTFEKLAAALAGLPRANFHHYCRQAIRASTSDEEVMLIALSKHDRVSLASLADLCRWINAKGAPDKSRAQRVAGHLKRHKLVQSDRYGLSATAKGRKEALNLIRGSMGIPSIHRKWKML